MRQQDFHDLPQSVRLANDAAVLNFEMGCVIIIQLNTNIIAKEKFYI